MQIVIDKSFLQGASADTVRRLCGEHTVLFIETLLYELLTTESEAVRTTCFAKLRGSDTSTVLIPRVGPLFRYEMKHLRPASPLSDHRTDATFESLVNGVFSRSLEDDPTLVAWKGEVRREVETFRQVATGVTAWCPALLEAPGAVLSSACQDLKLQACRETDVVRKVYLSLDLEGFPPASSLDPAVSVGSNASPLRPRLHPTLRVRRARRAS